MRRAVCLVALAFAASGCPRLPPPPARPSVVLERIERTGTDTNPSVRVRARLLVHNRDAVRLFLSAIDWELVLEDRALLRGRAHPSRVLAPGQRAAVELAISLPAPIAAELGAPYEGPLRLRGTVHMQDADGRGRPAPFDEATALR
jgi:hypothetical protein